VALGKGLAPVFSGGGVATGPADGVGVGVPAPSCPAVLLPGWNWVLMRVCALELGGASGEYSLPLCVVSGGGRSADGSTNATTSSAITP
jgi:hypothetical protein